MERGKRIEAINGESLLPEPIIQTIQSFLTVKEAAQTTVLSKSWYNAWSTGPKIDFDQRNLRRNGSGEDPNPLIPDRFSDFTRKKMQRYEELNLKIDSFRLCMESVENDGLLLADELIGKAMKMGAIDVDIELLSKSLKFTLPHEVLGSENLVRLSVNSSNIDLGADGMVNCSALKSLVLCNVHVEGDMIWNIVSRCPVIEKLVLNECKCLYEEQRFRHSVKMARRLELSPLVEFGKRNAGSIVNEPINLHVFHKLTYLMLKDVKIDPLFFRECTTKFPCIKDLCLDNCVGSKKIHICSRTLECIRIRQIVIVRANIDVPSLRKLNISIFHLPSLTFRAPPSREWECHMSVGCSSCLSYKWFRQFKKFLTKLSPSKIHLFLSYMPKVDEIFDYSGDIQFRPVIENWNIDMDALDCSALWDGLFWSCRPKLITTTTRFPKSDLKNLEFVCRRLMRLSDNCFIPNQSLYGQSDLQEANVERFDDIVAEWEPLSWKALLDISTKTEPEEKIRFHLKWR